MDVVRVLLVDDNERDLKSLNRLLTVGTDRFAVVNSYTTGAAAVRGATAKKNEFDVAIVDYRMPKMDGVAVAEKLKELRPEAKVLILTAHDDARDVIEASPYVDLFMEKVNIELLDEAILRLAAGDTVEPTAAPRGRHSYVVNDRPSGAVLWATEPHISL
jgi:two-component system response regulator YesN